MVGHVYPTIFAAGLQGEPDVVNRSYDLFSPGYAVDLSVAFYTGFRSSSTETSATAWSIKIHPRPRHQRAHLREWQQELRNRND
jgi:hypothetical protein